jgi:agarase
MGKTMTLYERPDRVEKAIPFISGKATWYAGYETNPYPWVTFRKVGSSWVPTHLPKFYHYWSRVGGDRYPVESSDPDIQVHAFVTNSVVHLCLNNIDSFNGVDVDISALFEDSMTVQNATVTRLYWDGSAPVLEEYAPLSTWSNVTLQAEEAAIVHLTLNRSPIRYLQLYQKSHYGDQTIQAYSGTPHTFNVVADMHRGTIHKAVLKVGVTRSFGTDVAPLVTFNGTPLPQATDWPGGTQEGVTGGAGGRDQFDGVIRMDVPAHLVQATNVVDVAFTSSGGYIATVILDVTSELPFSPPVDTALAASGLELSWTGSPALDYAIYEASSITSGIWTYLESVPGADGVVRHTNATDEAAAFFTVEAYVE